MLTAQVLPEVLCVDCVHSMGDAKTEMVFSIAHVTCGLSCPAPPPGKSGAFFRVVQKKKKKKCAAGAMEGENTQTSVDNPFGVQRQADSRHVGGTC